MTLVTREEAAEMVGCTPRTITRWADTGRLMKYLDVLGRVRFDQGAVSVLARAWTPPRTAANKEAVSGALQAWADRPRRW